MSNSQSEATKQLYREAFFERLSRNPQLDFLYCIKRIFNQPSIIAISGEWKSGKTDTALMIGYDVCIKKLHIFKKLGTNIMLSEPIPEVDVVKDLDTLRFWLHKDDSRKLFVLDEAIKFGYKRTPMSKMSIGLIQIMTELSKGHANGIYIAQDPTMLDKDLLSVQFVKGLIMKSGFYKRKEIDLYSNIIPGAQERHYYGLPRTSLKFDPYKEADFDISGDPLMSIPEMMLAQKWAKGGSMYALEKDPDVLKAFGRSDPFHPQEIRRIIQRVLKILLTYSQPKADVVMRRLEEVKKEPIE